MLKADTKAVISAVKDLDRPCVKKSTSPILKCVHIEVNHKTGLATLTTVKNENASRQHFSCESTKSFQAATNFPVFSQIINKLDSKAPITIDTRGSHENGGLSLSIESGKSRYELITLSDTFPVSFVPITQTKTDIKSYEDIMKTVNSVNKPELTEQQLKAIKFISDEYRISDMSGPHNIEARQILLEQLTGQKSPKAKSGISKLESVLWELSGLEQNGGCIADNEDILWNWIKETANPTPIVEHPQVEAAETPEKPKSIAQTGWDNRKQAVSDALESPLEPGYVQQLKAENKALKALIESLQAAKPETLSIPIVETPTIEVYEARQDEPIDAEYDVLNEVIEPELEVIDDSDIDLETWAVDYVEHLKALAPHKSKKLDGSLKFQLEQLQTAADVDRWKTRAQMAFDAKLK